MKLQYKYDLLLHVYVLTIITGIKLFNAQNQFNEMLECYQSSKSLL